MAEQFGMIENDVTPDTVVLDKKRLVQLLLDAELHAAWSEKEGGLEVLTRLRALRELVTRIRTPKNQVERFGP